jgi:hypothetical protein
MAKYPKNQGSDSNQYPKTEETISVNSPSKSNVDIQLSGKSCVIYFPDDRPNDLKP